MDGKITVKNIGTRTSGPSKLTLDCVKLEVPSQMNSCPELPPSFAATYFDPAFPKNATIKVPTLAPGKSFTHTLSFWNVLVWTTGKYKFTAIADPAHQFGERKTANTTTRVLTVP
jgi:hypothetical protein